jgi:uncharacterized LabA/DUF88 family protein
MRERAIVYVDGFNLYFGLRGSTGGNKKQTKRCYWLDIQKLAENIIMKRLELVAVKYFTARIKGNPEKENRQNAFLDAIRFHCDKLRIFEGRYLLREVFCRKCRKISNSILCPKCQAVNLLPEEKKSDVNVASQMLKDAYENLFDVAYLISGDSDLVPPIEIIRAMTPTKRVVVFFPPKRFSSELKDIASGHFFLKFAHINKSLLPCEILKPDGKTITIPSEWDL